MDRINKYMVNEATDSGMKIIEKYNDDKEKLKKKLFSDIKSFVSSAKNQKDLQGLSRNLSQTSEPEASLSRLVYKKWNSLKDE